jgi:hypothetical protein
VAKIGKNWPKIEFFDFFEKVSFFTVRSKKPEKRENSQEKFENLSILAYFGQF